MAVAAATVWEVRTTGADTNGGGFVAGATGVDYSQQNAAQYSGTDLAVDASLNTKVTSASHSFVANDVGNIMQLPGGGAFTAGFYQIVSVASGAATLDRSPAATSSTGGSYAVGGCLATLNKLATAMIGSNKAWVKEGTYISATLITFGASAVTPSPTAPYTTLKGYKTTRGDITPGVNAANRPQILCSTLGTSVITFSNAGWLVENLIVGPSGVATVNICITLPSFSKCRNCKCMNYSGRGFTLAATVALDWNEVTGGLTGTNGVVTSSTCVLTNNWFHDSLGTGINVSGSGCILAWNYITNCAGATSDGLMLTTYSCVFANVIYKSGRDNIRITMTSMALLMIKGNLLTEAQTGAGINCTNGGVAANVGWDGNAYYGNVGGTRLGLDDTATNPVNGSGPYTNLADLILTVDPFVDKTTDDYRLNNTVGGGADARAHGVPNSWPGLSFVGYRDMGPFQHAESAPGTTYHAY